MTDENMIELVKQQGERIAELERKIETTVLRFPRREDEDEKIENSNGAYVRFTPGKAGEKGFGGDIIFDLEAIDEARSGRIVFRNSKGRVGVFDFEKMEIRPLLEGERRPLDET